MKKCSSCSGELQRVGFFRTKGWQCQKCKGTFVRYRYLTNNELLAKHIDKAAKRSKLSQLQCLECGERMKVFKLGKIGLELDFCPNDYNIWFDVKEPERYVKWLRKHAPKGWKNPQKPSFEVMMAAIHLHE